MSGPFFVGSEDTGPFSSSMRIPALRTLLFITLLCLPGVVPAQDCWKNFPKRTSLQLNSEWCWAACFQMVSAFFERDVEQCRVVSAFYGIPACDNPRQTNLPVRDVAAFREFMADNNLKTKKGQSVKFDSVFLDGPLTESQIAAEVTHCRPVLAEISRSPFARATHLVVIVGIWKSRRGGFDVVVADPYPYSRFTRAAGGLHTVSYSRFASFWRSSVYRITPR